MPAHDDLTTSIRHIVELLDKLSLRFHCTGGLVASFYGEPRMTQDIDIVIQIGVGPDTDRLIDLLAQDYIIDADSIRDGIRRSSLFQALDKRTYIKIDFHVGEAVPGELDRSRLREVLPGLTVPVVSKEDAILSKLLWVRKGSHKSRRDIVMMLKRQGALDCDYLDCAASSLGVKPLLDELRAVDHFDLS